ncbi:hypothetical protein CN918_30765 [Priestia megaterium]|nr:hypothetical protein CN918_30765 [Priestia megaterium]
MKNQVENRKSVFDVVLGITGHPNWGKATETGNVWRENRTIDSDEGVSHHIANLLNIPYMINDGFRVLMQHEGYTVKIPIEPEGVYENVHESAFWNECSEKAKTLILPYLGGIREVAVFEYAKPLTKEDATNHQEEITALFQLLKEEGATFGDFDANDEDVYQQLGWYQERIVLLNTGNCSLPHLPRN